MRTESVFRNPAELTMEVKVDVRIARGRELVVEFACTAVNFGCGKVAAVSSASDIRHGILGLLPFPQPSAVLVLLLPFYTTWSRYESL